MTDILGIILVVADFIAPAFAVWYLVLRRTEGPLASSLAAAGLSAFLVPTLIFLLNRTVNYPIDRLGMTILAITLVAGAFAWHWLVEPRMAPLSKFATRIGRFLGGTLLPEEDKSRSRFS